jgi:glyoxylase-like metal-dependent hydrolase (beta-lactamase superfamily II)
MNDPTAAAAQLDPAALAPLRFPFSDVPAPGTTVEVAAGVFWLRMPLPFALNHINLWMLRDEAGWTLVDCGLNSAATRELWEHIFAWALPQGPVRRLIVTHYHPDHFGLAGWLTQRFGIEVWMTEGEYLSARAFLQGLPGYCMSSSADLFALHGLDSAQVEHQRTRGNTYRLGVGEPPAGFRRIMDGDEIGVDGRNWRVIMGYGHAPEHAALYCGDLGVLISGDMVLPRISTNISVWAAQPNGDPLKLFLDSVDRYARLPAATRVLPSHGPVFHGLQTRARQLQEHHEQRLHALLEACARPVTAAQVLQLLFQRPLDSHQMLFAMGEAIAHLNHLMHRGNVTRETGSDGVMRFAAASESFGRIGR